MAFISGMVATRGGVCRRRYGSVEKFKKMNGMDYKSSSHTNSKNVTEAKIIAILRKFAHINNRNPTYKDFKKKNENLGVDISTTAIRRIFGSWNRAMIAAGFDIIVWKKEK